MQSNFKHRTQQKRIGDSTSDQWIVIHKKERHKLSLPFIMIRLNMWYARSSTRCNFNVLPRQIATVFSRGRHHFAPLAAARNLGERLDASLSSLLSDKPNSSLTDAFQRAAEWHELEIQVEELSAALTMPSLVGLVDEAAAKETQAAEVRCAMCWVSVAYIWHVLDSINCR